MKAPDKAQLPPSQLPRGKGKMVGIMAIGKEKYLVIQAVLKDGVVTSLEMFPRCRKEGESMPVALQYLNVAAQNHVKENASELWK